MAGLKRSSTAPARLEDVLDSPRIPTLPAVALQVLELTKSDEANLNDVARVIQNDQALALKIIRTVNSSFYGLSRPCTTIKQAIVYLGLNAVKTLALGFSLVDSIDGGGAEDVSFDYVDYWRRAIYSAGAAWEIAQCTGSADPEEAFLAALVQDVGMIAMNRAFGDMYLQAIDLTEGDHAALVAIEQRTFKLNHADVGAAMTARWKMPPSLIEAIRLHHRSNETPDQWRELVRVVQLSHLAAAAIDSGQSAEAAARFRDRAHDWCDVGADRCEPLIRAMSESARELAQLFRVTTGGKAGIDAVLAQAEQAQLKHQGDLLTESARLAPRSNAELSAAVDGATRRPADPERFRELLQKAFDRTNQRCGSLAVMIVRIDGPFEPHTSADGDKWMQLLGAIAERVDRQVGAFGIVCRHGDGQFSILLPHTDRNQAMEEAEVIRRIIETEYGIEVNAGATRFATTASIGIAAVEPGLEQDVPTPDVLHGLAGRALAEARESGGNCVRVMPRKLAGNRAA